MGGRLALVIGSECDAMRKLGFTGQRAADLHDALVGSDAWRPVVDEGPVVDPDITSLKAAITGAFAAADIARATLLVAFIGHGIAKGAKDHYLLARDSPASPDSDTAFHLVQGIRERLDEYESVDGLVVLVDACEAGEGLKGAAERWDVLRGGGRVELLVASTRGSAYNGCFTSTLVRTFAAGVPRAGESLRCADVEPALSTCPGQEAARLAFTTGTAVSTDTDDGLWLVPNVARRDDAVRGLSSAGLVDQLTRGVIATDAVRESLTAVVEAGHHRLRLVTGPAGCGKSTLMSLLIRPGLVDTVDVTARYVDAAVFLDPASTIQTVTDHLVVQLSRRVDGFQRAGETVAADLDDTDRATADAFELSITRPLERCRRPGRSVTILIDGLDQPEEGTRNLIAAAITRLTLAERTELAHVRVIVAARSGATLDYLETFDHAHCIDLQPPSPRELVLAVQARVGQAWKAEQLTRHGPVGGWLIARLLNETRSSQTSPNTLAEVTVARFAQALRDSGPDWDIVRAVLCLCIAAGSGPVLPLVIVREAFQSRGSDQSLRQIRDCLVLLGALITRGRPGEANELIGIAHTAIVGILADDVGATDMLDAHTAIAKALDQVGSDDEELRSYADAARPRHLLLSGQAEAALFALYSAIGSRAADNRDLWATWLPSFVGQLGPDHPATLLTRNNLAHWLGEAGDTTGAAQAYRELLADRLRVLGPDHPDTLTTRNNLAHWLGEAGDNNDQLHNGDSDSPRRS